MRSRIKTIIASILPGIFIIGYNVGTGSITSMSKAGANFGLDLLWAVAISCIVTYYLIILFSRFTMVTGETFIEGVKRHIHPGLAIFLIGILVALVKLADMADIVPGVSATITYDQCEEWGAANPVSFQIVITPTTMRVRYDPNTVYPLGDLVGLHNGVAQVGTPGSDLNGGAVAPVTGNPDSILDLTCTATPKIGGALGMELSGLPAGGIGAVLAIIGVSSPGASLPQPPFVAGCEVYIPQSSPSLGLVVNASACASYPFSIFVPLDNVWLNLPFACQGAALDVVTSEFRTSQVLDARVGNY